MHNTKEDLESLIKKIIERVLKEQEESKKKKNRSIYIVFNENWDNRYYFVIEELNRIKKEGVRAVILSDTCDAYKNKIEKSYSFEKVIGLDEFVGESQDIVILPIVDRNEIIHIANCLSTTKTSKLVKKCFENGNKIYILKYGIEKFTGKEPELYKKKILKHYETVFEFDIEVIEKLEVVM